ncbi:hypothetical protein H8356DRAFT_1340522 [Neocallimastix lanati (nom. inval.)]|nr:hypothetical protein H8356DRAFT_1340522 [Neocallimastix sp. JGI-2020a]
MVKRNETNEDEREDRARNVVKLRRAVEITRECFWGLFGFMAYLTFKTYMVYIQSLLFWPSINIGSKLLINIQEPHLRMIKALSLLACIFSPSLSNTTSYRHNFFRTFRRKGEECEKIPSIQYNSILTSVYVLFVLSLFDPSRVFLQSTTTEHLLNIFYSALPEFECEPLIGRIKPVSYQGLRLVMDDSCDSEAI